MLSTSTGTDTAGSLKALNMVIGYDVITIAVHGLRGKLYLYLRKLLH